jgi:hypothetical protein
LRFPTRNGIVLAAGLALLAAAAPSGATDVRYGVTIGGRRLDKAGHSGLLHRGVTFVNVQRAIAAFDGILVFLPSGVLRAVVGNHTIVFTVGSRTALLDGTTIRLSGAPFVLAGNSYVPVAAIATLTRYGASVDPKRRVVDLEPGAGSVEAALPATPAASAGAPGDVAPSPARALSFVPSATSDAAGLHAKVNILNVTGKPYTVVFPGGARVAFVVSRDGKEVWRSGTGRPPTAAVRLTLAPRATTTERSDWPAFARRPPGRYTLRVQLLTAPPLDGTPISLGVATPAPSPASS